MIRLFRSTRSALLNRLHGMGSCCECRCCRRRAACWSGRRWKSQKREKLQERAMETDSVQPWVRRVLGEVSPSRWGLLHGSCTENTQQMNSSNHLIHFSVTLRHTARITPRPKTIKSGILYRRKIILYSPET